MPKVKQTLNVMVWGVVSGAGLAGLWMMPKNTTMNGKMYRNILREKLPNFVNFHDINHIQQDDASCPCHGTKAVKSWLKHSAAVAVAW